MDKFEASLQTERRKHSSKNIWVNMTLLQKGFMRKQGKNEVHKIISTDTNCGLSVIKTEHLTEHGIKDHLNNVAL